MSKLSKIVGIAVMAAIMPVYAQADVLLIERAEQAQRAAVPKNGTTMAQVEAQFGTPIEKLAPVAGNKPQHPPISRWRYADFTVYFEHQRVISTVLNTSFAQSGR
jgi:hypothetical protein